MNNLFHFLKVAHNNIVLGQKTKNRIMFVLKMTKRGIVFNLREPEHKIVLNLKSKSLLLLLRAIVFDVHIKKASASLLRC